MIEEHYGIDHVFTLSKNEESIFYLATNKESTLKYKICMDIFPYRMEINKYFDKGTEEWKFSLYVPISLYTIPSEAFEVEGWKEKIWNVYLKEREIIFDKLYWILLQMMADRSREQYEYLSEKTHDNLQDLKSLCGNDWYFSFDSRDAYDQEDSLWIKIKKSEE